MRLCYAGCSAPSAQLIADESDDIYTVRNGRGDINWGREWADTELNPDIRNVTNKRVMRELFREHGVPTPALFTPDEAWRALGEKPYVLIGRPDKHRKGRGFWKVKTERRYFRAIKGTRRKKAATHFMEYIEHDHEYRVHIFKGRSIRISEKAFDDDDAPMYRKNYTTVKPGPDAPRKALRRAAKAAVKAVGLDFGAVDIITNADGVYVLEVNAAPGLGGSMPRVYARAFEKWERGE